MNVRVPRQALVWALLPGLLLGSAAWAQTQPPKPPAPPQPPRPPAQAQPHPATQPAAKSDQAAALPHIDSARKLYHAGKLLQSADELSAAIDAIYGQLAQRYAVTLPPAPQGWTVEPLDPQRQALLGGPPPAARDYRQAGGQGHMNARIILDSDAVSQIAPLFAPQLPPGVSPNVKRIKIGDQDAVVAYDTQRHAGEVSVIVGNRLLLQVEGLGVANADPMIATMRGWNIAELKRLAGL